MTSEKPMQQKSETIRSILCGEQQWDHEWDHYERPSYIKFKEDGTGTIWLSSGLVPWFICDFDWKLTGLDWPVQSAETWFNRTQLLTKFEIDIIYRTVGDPEFDTGQGFSGRRHPGPYRGEIPRPRRMTVKLEKGIFPTPLAPPAKPCHCELRLTFEPSPYGTRQEWQKGKNALWDFPFWDRKEFVARSCAAPEPWSSCVIS